MSKILIVGAGVEQLPAIIEAQSMGHIVICTDMSLNAPGIRFADKAYQVSTTDVEGNTRVASEENVDGVMTICSETAVPTVAGVAEALSLPGFNRAIALKATNKDEMRKALAKNKVEVSPYIIAGNIEEIKDYIFKNKPSWVIKPVDSSGQRGTFVVNSEQEIEKVFEVSKSYSPSRRVMIDQLIRGREIHVTMNVIEGKLHFLALTDRITLNDKYFGICIRHLGHAILEPDERQSICDLCEKSVDAIGLKNGVVTCEVILSNAKPTLMEIAIRVPGGYLRDVAMYLSGVDIIKTTIWNSLGIKKSFDEIKTEETFPAISVKFISKLNMPAHIDRIERIDKMDEIKNMPGIKLFRIHHNIPFDVPNLESSVGRFGAIIGIGQNQDEALANTENAFNLLRVNGEKLKEYNEYNKFNIKYN